MAGQGLEGVVVADTHISEVSGRDGRLAYGGYPIEDLAEHASFEEVCHLLWYGDLPVTHELEHLDQRLRHARAVHPDTLRILRLLPTGTHPMAALRTAVSALAGFDEDAESGDPNALGRTAIRLTAQMPTLVAAFERIRSGHDPIEPHPGLGHAANFLYMLSGDEPDELSARIIDAALTLHAEHGMNASTFAARVTCATLADMYSAVTSALGTLKGALHGGANEQVMGMLEEIGEPERAAPWVRAALDRGEKIMGFGHRVYRTLDPRAPILKRLAGRLAGAAPTNWLAISERVQEVMATEMRRRGREVHANVDFFSASLYATLGIPRDQFTSVFACARVAGWTAHVLEQLRNNRLIRPESRYVGPTGRRLQPLPARG
jgi:citrate synthase